MADTRGYFHTKYICSLESAIYLVSLSPANTTDQPLLQYEPVPCDDHLRVWVDKFNPEISKELRQQLRDLEERDVLTKAETRAGTELLMLVAVWSHPR